MEWIKIFISWFSVILSSDEIVQREFSWSREGWEAVKSI